MLFWWMLIWIGCFSGPGRLLKKINTEKKFQVSEFFTKITKFHPNFLPKMISKILLSLLFKKFLLLGEFNAEVHDYFLKVFCDLYYLKTLIKEPICFKNPENPSCIDFTLTNSYRRFHKSCTIETTNEYQISNRMIVTVMKLYFHKET